MGTQPPCISGNVKDFVFFPSYLHTKFCTKTAEDTKFTTTSTCETLGNAKLYLESLVDRWKTLKKDTLCILGTVEKQNKINYLKMHYYYTYFSISCLQMHKKTFGKRARKLDLFQSFIEFIKRISPKLHSKVFQKDFLRCLK